MYYFIGNLRKFLKFPSLEEPGYFMSKSPTVVAHRFLRPHHRLQLEVMWEPCMIGGLENQAESEPLPELQPSGLKSSCLLGPRMALLENRGPRKGNPIDQSGTHFGCIRVILERVWAASGHPALSLGSPLPGLPTVGRFYSLHWVPLGDGPPHLAQHPPQDMTEHNALEAQGENGTVDGLIKRSTGVTGHRRLHAFPVDRVPSEKTVPGLKELFSCSKHKATISEAINKIWLYDSRYKPIGAKTSEECHTLRLFLGSSQQE